jgi:hypothetical protein
MRELTMSAAVLAAALTTLTLAGGASALTLKEGETTCARADVTFAGMTASACEGAYSGNDSNSNLDGVFGITGWTELVKLDASSGSVTADGVTLSVFLDDRDERSGSWSVSGWGGHDTVMAVLKGGPSFAAYMFDTLAGTEGTWSTDGLRAGGPPAKAGGNPRRGRPQGPGPQRPIGIVGDTGGKTPGLSHFTLYSGSSASEPPVAPNPPAVPLPAAAWLLLSACAGLMMLRRRAA